MHNTNSPDVLFVSTPRYRRTPRDTRRQPPLAFTYLASYLEARGIRCAAIDGYTENPAIDELVERIINCKPYFLGINTVSEDRFHALELAYKIRQRRPEIVIVAGGPHFGNCPEDTLNSVASIDAVVCGEGEQTLYELVCRYRFGDPCNLTEVKGLAFRDEDGRPVVNEPRTESIDFNLLAPAWHLFDLSRYTGGLCLENQTRAIGVVSSRGCANTCAFCANSLQRNVHYKQPARFVDEVEVLVREYGFSGLNIQDDSFTSDRRHVLSICREILKRDLHFRWYCSLRVDETDEELLQNMKAAGCIALGFGIESGSDVVLRRVCKGTNTDLIYEAVRAAVTVGFEQIGLFVMTSLPGETEKTFAESQRFINSLYRLIYPGWTERPILGSIALVYPGTTLEKLARQNGCMSKSFSWNLPYNNPKAKIMKTNAYMPHFENSGFPLEKIRRCAISTYDVKEVQAV